MKALANPYDCSISVKSRSDIFVFSNNFSQNMFTNRKSGERRRSEKYSQSSYLTSNSKCCVGRKCLTVMAILSPSLSPVKVYPK